MIGPDQPYPEAGRRSPFAPGGAGDYFVHVSNRAATSALFPREAFEAQGGFAVLERFGRLWPPGYATLYVLEKLCAVGSEGLLDPDPPRRTNLPRGYAVVPERGQAWTGLSLNEAFQLARTHARAKRMRVVITRLVDTLDWT